MSVADSLRFVGGVALATWSKGIIIRRPFMVGVAERLGLDRKAIRHMQSFRSRYGEGPLLVRNPVRPQAVIFAAGDVRRVLSETPEPFSPASSEKRAALSHFEPDTSLISAGPERAARRALNDAALESGTAVHSLADGFMRIVGEEGAALLRAADALGSLDWPLFFEAWMRVARRVVLGEGARADNELTEMIARLRSRANWAFALPRRRRLRAAFHARLQAHLSRAEPGSLAGRIASLPAFARAAPTHQVAQWLFAFDPAGMATFRTLALLATHPDMMKRARAEIAARDRTSRSDLTFLRACVVDTLRLYPTTPMVLRQGTRQTEWKAGVLPAGTGFLIYAPFFHRDDQRMPAADRFDPDRWLRKDPAEASPLIPFSAGPAACPARQLVPMLASAMLAEMLDGDRLTLLHPETLRPDCPLPGTLNNYALRFGLSGRPGRSLDAGGSAHEGF